MASDRTRVAAIRAMELEDVDAVMAIETAAQLTPWNGTHFCDCLGNANYLCQVATVDDVPVAFLILSRILDETQSSTSPWPRPGSAMASPGDYYNRP